MNALRNMVSMVVLSGTAALFGAGCLGQGDDRVNDEAAEQTAINAEGEAATANANPDDAANGGDEETGESQDRLWWGGYRPWLGGAWNPWFRPWLSPVIRPWWGGYSPWFQPWLSPVIRPWWGGYGPFC